MEYITLGHGAGGSLTLELIDEVFLKNFSNDILLQKNDSSVFDIEGKIAMTTDSYVVDPIFFPGGNIGKLSVCGTLNDLLVTGAEPLYLSAGFIIEEGFLFDDLLRIVASMSEEANKGGVQIVTGDTKVVPKGFCDKLFINTTGIGKIIRGAEHLSQSQCLSGDHVLVSGFLGDHAMAILGARNNIRFEKELNSDVASLNDLIMPLLKKYGKSIRFMRDITRGGLAMIANELCNSQNYGINLHESEIPVRSEVQGLCEAFGFDPLHLANEGKVFMVVEGKKSGEILKFIQGCDLGKHAAIIGEISRKLSGKVVLNSIIEGTRIVDMPLGELIPRIC